MDASSILKSELRNYLLNLFSYEVNLSGQFDPLEDTERIYIEVTVSPVLEVAGEAEIFVSFASKTGAGIDQKLSEVVVALQQFKLSPPLNPIFATQLKLLEVGDIEAMMTTRGNEEFFLKAAKLQTKYIERGE